MASRKRPTAGARPGSVREAAPTGPALATRIPAPLAYRLRLLPAPGPESARPGSFGRRSGGKRAIVSEAGRGSIAPVRIREWRIACASCGRAVAEVGLLKPDRSLCPGCLAERTGADVETMREWLRSGGVRVVRPG